MEKREHDLFLDMKSNPTATLDDLVVAGLTAENTALQDKSAYENDDWVRELFKNEYGDFDLAAFDTFYNNAKVYYNSLANADYEKSMNNIVSFHRDNIFVPVELRRKGPDFTEMQVGNPYHITSSIIELGRTGERTQSVDELALANKVLLNPTTAGENLENAKWGESPNENFFGYFDDTLVLAQYNENGTHIDPFTGKQVSHQAGTPKTDKNGEFYYEKLDGRDVYGKRVLKKMNVLTVDGSKWNDYDFFDSDDINLKSAGASVMKNLALVGSMFIPGIGPWIAGLSIASLTVGLLGTLGKMLVGSNSPTLSAMEGWSESVSRQGGMSEYAMEHPWCLENMINLAGDVAGLIMEQRVLFTKIPSLFKGLFPLSEEAQAAKIAKFKEDRLKLVNLKMDELKKANVDDLVKIELNLKLQAGLDAVKDLQAWTKEYQSIGEILGKGYMTAITVQDTYGEAKLAGASDIDATLLTLGYAAGEYALLSTGLGKWFMPELRANKVRYEAIAKTIAKLGDESKLTAMQTARKSFDAVKDKKNYIKNIFNIGKNLAKDVYTANKSTSKNLAVSTFYNGLSEGFEEVSEELLADFSKGCYDVVKWLQGEDVRLDSFGYNFKKKEFNLDDTLDRYSLSLVGGFLGGGFANIAGDFRELNSLNKINSESALLELIYMCRNGEIKDFMKTVYKTPNLGDPNKSTKFQVLDDKIIFSPGTKDDNLDVAIKNIILKLVNLLQDIIQANGGTTDSEFLNKQTLDDLRFSALLNSTTAGLYLQTYNNLLADIYTLTAAINDAKSVDTNKDGIETDKEKSENKQTNKSAIPELQKQLKEKQLKLLDMLDGKYALDFISTALIEINGTMSKMGGIPSVFSLYAESKYKKKFLDLTDKEKQDAVEEFKTLKTTEYRDLLSTFSQMYRLVASLVSPVLTNQSTNYLKASTELQRLNKVISDLYNIVSVDNKQERLDILAALKIPAEKYLPLALIAASSAFSQSGQEIQALRLIILQIQLSNDEGEIKSLNELLENIPVFHIGYLIANITNDESFIDFINSESKRLNDLYELSKKLSDAIKNNEDVENNLLLIKLNNEAIEDLFLNFISTTQDKVVDNIDKIASEFINLGFINTESKNLISKLIEFAKSIINNKYNLFDEFERQSLSEENPYIGLLNHIKDLETQIQNLNSTPLELNLNEVAILLGEQPIKLTELIEQANTIFNSMAEDVTTFDMATNIAEGIKEALNLMNLYKLSILGARTDANNANNLYGYNATLNEIAGKIKLKLDLAEIDSITADKFLADLDANINKLTYLLNLYNINNSLKLTKNDRVGVKKDLLIYKKLKYTFDFPDKDNPLASWNNIDKVQQAIRGMELHEKALNNKVEDKEAFEREKIVTENAIYEFFQANLDKLSDPTKLAELINPFNLDLYSPVKEILDENLDNLDDNSFVWWLASRAALKSEDFYHMYASVIDPTSENPIAPIPTLELAIYNNVAAVINKKVFSQFYNAYRYSIKNDWRNRNDLDKTNILKRFDKDDEFIEVFKSKDFDDYIFNFIQVPRYTNIILTEGAPGTGKSLAVFVSTISILRKYYPKLFEQEISVVHGANIKSADKLKNDVGIKNASTYGRREFMKFINSLWREYVKNDQDNTYSVPDSEAGLNFENEFRSKLDVNSNTNPPSLIIIDEISKFSTYDLDLIDKYALKHGITVLVAGDFDQSGFVGMHSVDIGNIKNRAYKINLDRPNFIRCPKLGVCMRTDNDLKTMNLAKTRYYKQDPKGKLELSYALDEGGIYGDKVINYDDISFILPDVINDVNSLIEIIKHDGELDEEEKIGYIYNDINSPIYKELSLDKYKPYITLKQGGTALGLEGRFYIVEPNIEEDTETLLKDIYTGMSRASLGSIIILPYDSLVDINSGKPKPFVQKESLPKEVIINYAQNRKELLTKISTNGKIPDIQSSEVSLPALKVTTKSVLEDGIDSIPPYNYEEDKINFIHAINTLTNIDDIDRFANDLKVRSLGRSETDLEVIDAINKRKAELSKHEDNDKIELGEKHDSLTDKYVGKYTNDELFIKDGVRADGARMVAKISDLDPNVTALTNGLWFLPGDVLTTNDGRTISFDWLWSDGSMGSEDGTTISNIEIEKFFTGLHSVITHNSRLGYAAELTEEAPVEIPLNSLKYYEADTAPTTSVDVIPTEIVQLSLDSESESDINIKGNEIRLHTFNKFELGGIINSNGLFETIGGQAWLDMRIDGINGLIKIDKLLGTTHSITDYISIIGRLRTAICTIANKSDLEKEIENILGLSGIYTTFALKSTARVGKQGRADDRNYVSVSPNPFEKSWKEKTLYNVSNDTRSDEVNNKSLVIIIGTDRNLLEIPLLQLGSPFTLLASQYGQSTWPDMYREYSLKTLNRENIHDISVYLYNTYKNKPGYSSIIKHLEFFNIDANLIKYIEDPNWTIVNGFLNLGINFITNAGYYQYELGLDFNDVTNPESEWITLNNFSKGRIKGRPETMFMNEHPLFKVTPILTSDVIEYDTLLPIRKGHSFVIVSADENYSTPEDIVNRYLAELQDSTLPKVTLLVYVLPPKASIEEYIINLHNANFTLRGERDSLVKPIGYFSTSAKLLMQLVEDPEFMDLVNRKYPKVVPLLTDAIKQVKEATTPNGLLAINLANNSGFMNLASVKYPKLYSLLSEAKNTISDELLVRLSKDPIFSNLTNTNRKLKDVLFSEANWSEAGISYKSTNLFYLFDELLARLGWLDVSSSFTGTEPVHQIDKESINIITNCLNKVGINGVFYHTPISNKSELQLKIGPFKIGAQIDLNNYSIDGKPYFIHGKVDPFTFQGDIDWLIDSFLNSIRVNKSNGMRFTPDNTTYFDHGRIGNSSLKKPNTLERKYKNFEAYIKSKTGIDITLDRNAPNYGLDKAVELINNSEINLVAFIINNDIIISNKNSDLSGKIYLYDNADNPIRNISNLSDNSGIYSFKISAIIDGKLLKLGASYDSRTKVMEIERVPNEYGTLQLSVTPETFDDWIKKAREILIDIAENDLDVEDLLAIDNYDEFISAVNEWVGTEIMKWKYTDMLNNTSDEQSKQIIADMINIEEFGMKDDLDTCLPKIKVTF